MKLDRDEKTRINRLPCQQIPSGVAVGQYASAVAVLMDELAENKYHTTAKQMGVDEFEWFIAWDRCKNPDYTPDDLGVLTKYLVNNSKAYLKCKAGSSGGKWIGIEELNLTPDLVIAKYEQHARGLIAGKKSAPQVVNGLVERYSTPTSTPLTVLKSWAARHPQADKQWLLVAETALEQLLKE